MNTLVFLDFETTGLFKGLAKPFGADRVLDNSKIHLETFFRENLRRAQDYPHFCPSLTEISLLAVSRQEFLHLSTNRKNGHLNFTNILTNLVNPDLTEEEWNSEITRNALKITGLTRSQLESAPKFEDIWPDVNGFLSAQPKPICLIAHNGFNFDFRLLHINTIGKRLQMCKVFILDTFHAFTQLDELFSREVEAFLCKDPSWGRTQEETLMNSESSQDLLKDQISANSLTHTPSKSSQCSQGGFHTPEKSPLKMRPVDLSQGPDSWCEAKRTQLRSPRHLTYSPYKLGNLYKRHLGQERKVAHRAGQDCEDLLKICATYGREFLDYMDENAFEF